MSLCSQLLWIQWMLKTGASGWRYRKITWTVGVVEFGDSGRWVRPQNRAWASSQWEADNITHGKQRSEIWRNHGLQKRGIAAGHVRVVDYVSSWISAKVSCSLALLSPDNSFVCANSLRLLFCSTQVSLPKIKYNLIFLYTYVFLMLITIQYIIQQYLLLYIFVLFLYCQILFETLPK